MTEVHGPYVKARCKTCLALIEALISARRASADMDDIRDDPDWRCAECAADRAALEEKGSQS